jgi:hypothetical protein
MRRRSPSCAVTRRWPVAAARARAASGLLDPDPMAQVCFDPSSRGSPAPPPPVCDLAAGS